MASKRTLCFQQMSPTHTPTTAEVSSGSVLASMDKSPARITRQARPMLPNTMKNSIQAITRALPQSQSLSTPRQGDMMSTDLSAAAGYTIPHVSTFSPMSEATRAKNANTNLDLPSYTINIADLNILVTGTRDVPHQQPWPGSILVSSTGLIFDFNKDFTEQFISWRDRHLFKAGVNSVQGRQLADTLVLELLDMIQMVTFHGTLSFIEFVRHVTAIVQTDRVLDTATNSTGSVQKTTSM